MTSHDLVRILQTVVYFTDRNFCKIVKLYDMDLKFVRSISDVNIDNGAQFYEGTIHGTYIKVTFLESS